MKNISEKRLKILVGIGFIVWGLLSAFFSRWLRIMLHHQIIISTSFWYSIVAKGLLSAFINPLQMLPFLILYIAILTIKKEGKCHLYRWIILGILFQPIMSGYGIWRTTKNILIGLSFVFMVGYAKNLLFRYLWHHRLYNFADIYYMGFAFTFGLILTFIILRWAWRRLPDEMKVYGWR